MTFTGPQIAHAVAAPGGQTGLFFDEAEFLRRLLTEANTKRPIGVALDDPQIITGLGPYRRATVLSDSRIDPCQPVGVLSASKLERLCRALARTDTDRCRSRRNTAMS